MYIYFEMSLATVRQRGSDAEDCEGRHTRVDYCRSTQMQGASHSKIGLIFCLLELLLLRELELRSLRLLLASRSRYFLTFSSTINSFIQSVLCK